MVRKVSFTVSVNKFVAVLTDKIKLTDIYVLYTAEMT